MERVVGCTGYMGISMKGPNISPNIVCSVSNGSSSLESHITGVEGSKKGARVASSSFKPSHRLPSHRLRIYS